MLTTVKSSTAGEKSSAVMGSCTISEKDPWSKTRRASSNKVKSTRVVEAVCGTETFQLDFLSLSACLSVIPSVCDICWLVNPFPVLNVLSKKLSKCWHIQYCVISSQIPAFCTFSCRARNKHFWFVSLWHHPRWKKHQQYNWQGVG